MCFCCSDGRHGRGHPIPHDPDFNGPLKHRSCTDIICLLLFVVFVGCWLGVGLYAFKNGDPSAILIPRDSNGLRCGVDVKGKPNLFFFDLTKCIGPSVPFLGCPTPQVCVEKCPDYTYFPTDSVNENLLICRDEIKPKKPDGIHCAKWYLPSTPIQKRCIPDLTSTAEEEFQKFEFQKLSEVVKKFKLFTETEQVGQNIVKDIVESWPKILIGLLVALLITLIYILMLRWTAGVMVWISIIGVLVALSLGTYGSWWNYRRILNQQKELDDESYNDFRKYFWLTALIVCSVVLAVLLLITIFLRKRISLAIALIEEGSKAISSVISVFIFPLFPWILHLVVAGFFIAVALLLTTTGSPYFRYEKIMSDNSGPDNSNCMKLLHKDCDPSHDTPCLNLTCKLKGMKHNQYYNYMQWFNVFGFFWGSFFASAFGQMVLASVFATWYWTKPRSKLSFFAVTSSTLNVMRYHIGTLAFGSLIITICRMIRLVLEYFDRKLKKYDNEVTRAIMCLLKCFFWCLEKFLKFMNTNAYIMCAIHGKNFCTSAREAFMLLMRNIIRVFVLDKVTDFLFFVSSLLISIAVGVLAYFFFTTNTATIDNSNLNYVEVPVIVITVCTYFIAKIFFNVYSMAVDTLFLCFLEDCERNDGSPDRPYYMSKDLMKIFGKKNKVE